MELQLFGVNIVTAIHQMALLPFGMIIVTVTLSSYSAPGIPAIAESIFAPLVASTLAAASATCTP